MSHHVASAYLGGQVLELVDHYTYLGFIYRQIFRGPTTFMYLQQIQKNHGHSLPAVLKQCG